MNDGLIFQFSDIPGMHLQLKGLSENPIILKHRIQGKQLLNNYLNIKHLNIRNTYLKSILKINLKIH